MKHDGGPAFPRPCGFADENSETWSNEQEGMSLRDWFAGLAMQGMLSAMNFTGLENVASEQAYRVADAMLKARG